MINFCMAAKEYQKYNGEVSTAMLLVCIFQFVYVADCLFYEVRNQSREAVKIIHHIGVTGTCKYSILIYICSGD